MVKGPGPHSDKMAFGVHAWAGSSVERPVRCYCVEVQEAKELSELCEKRNLAD